MTVNSLGTCFGHVEFEADLFIKEKSQLITFSNMDYISFQSKNGF